MIPNKLGSASWKENKVTHRLLDKFVAKQTSQGQKCKAGRCDLALAQVAVLMATKQSALCRTPGGTMAC